MAPAKRQISLHKYENEFGIRQGRLQRLELIKAQTKVDLVEFEQIDINPEAIYQKNIENLIGAISLPLGVAGPIIIQPDNEQHYVPLATTEGALVASINRGIKVINKSGGATVYVDKVGMSRAPLFETTDIDHGMQLIKFITKNFLALKKEAASTNKYLKLLSITPFQTGKLVWLRFVFDTSEAMGMNMATVASEQISLYLLNHFPELNLISLSGNLCVDKKPSALNQILGRGYKTQAEVIIPKEIVEEDLHTSVAKIVQVNISKCWQGGMIAGNLGANAHMANVIAAVFAACGQDLAQVADCASGYTLMKEVLAGLYVSVTLPVLEIGVIGGGTHLSKQSKMLQLICKDIGNNKVQKPTSIKFAQVITAAILAGEISLHAALASQDLATAHQQLGRSIK